MMRDTVFYWSESGRGKAHLHPDSRGPSLCGSVTSYVPRPIRTEYAAHKLVAGEREGYLNSDLCKNCWRIAKDEHRDDWRTVLELADEYAWRRDQ